MSIAIPVRVLLIVLASFVVQADSNDTDTPKPLASATVGAPRVIEDVILPGSEMVAKPITGDPEMIVQIEDAIPHGDSFRYTIRFSGLEPGDHDLADWLMRKDGSAAGELPAIPVTIESLLPAGQITPNQLPEGWIPNMGGYKVVMTVAAAIWGLVLLVLMFGGRKKKDTKEESVAAPRSLADLLKDRLEAAFENKVGPEKYAELERMLFSMWRKRLGYESLPLQEAMSKIKSDEQAGPLMVQLENWMHRPASDNQDVDLSKLLEPYRNLSVNELESAK